MDQTPERIKKAWYGDVFNLDDKLVAEFEITIDESRRPTDIEAVFFWNKYPDDRYTVNIQSFNRTQDLSHTFVNGIRLWGWLKGMPFHSTGDNDNAGIMGDLHLGIAGRPECWHYEGFMITFQTSQPPPPPPPYSPPDRLRPSDIITQTQDLFPYIYIHTWPNVTDQEMRMHFVNYKDGPPNPPGPFYKRLHKMRFGSPPSPRQDLEQLAVNYINGAPGWEYQFVRDVTTLPGAIKHFLDLNIYVRDLQESDINKIIQRIQTIIHLKHDEWEPYTKSEEYIDSLNRVQDSYFALIITMGYDLKDLHSLITTLTMANLFETLITYPEFFSRPEIFHTMAVASIIIPKDVYPLPPFDSSPPPSLHQAGWIEPYAIGDLKMVRYSLSKYEMGEIAHIVNVLKGERREIKNRSLNFTAESLRDEKGYHQVIENEDTEGRTNLLAETQKTIADTIAITEYDKNKGFKTTYGPPSTVNFEGSWSVETKQNSDAPSNEHVTRFARNILNRTVNRISQKIYRTRISTNLKESEETITSVFDNVGTDRNIRGIYRWLNKIYRVFVIPYGNRLMIEFMMKDPALAFIRSESENRGVSLSEPLSLEDFGVSSYQDIHPGNYATLAAYYGVTNIHPPPVEKRLVSATLQPGEEKLISIPPGYEAVLAYVNGVFPGNGPGVKLEGLIGRTPFSLDFQHPGTKKDGIPMNGEDTAVLAVMTSGTPFSSPPVDEENYFATVEIKCICTGSHKNRWKLKTYEALLEGFHREKAAYYQRAGVQKGAEYSPRSPLNYRRIERRTLKQDCVRLLIGKHLDLVGLSRQMVPPQFVINEPRYIQFFEGVFEWDEMTYNFYRDYAKKGTKQRLNWFDIAEIAGDDGLFTQFLQADLARVMVPVNPNDTLRILYFLSSGMIWSEDNALTPVDWKNVSIANELKKALSENPNPDEHESDSWEITVPTAMQVLQDNDDLPN